MTDAIIRELWRVKDEIAKACNYDIGTLGAELARRQREQGKAYVDLPQRNAGEEHSVDGMIDTRNIDEAIMPAISMFYGIIISLYYNDSQQHHQPHIHAKFQDQKAVVAIPDGELLAGSLPPGKMRILLGWIELHRDELMADWELAVQGQEPFKIDPLR